MCKNFLMLDSVWLSVFRVWFRLVELLVSICDIDVMWLVNCIICLLFFDSVLISICRFLMVLKMLLCEFFSCLVICVSLCNVLCNEFLLLLRVFVVWLIVVFSGFCSLFVVGFRLVVNWVSFFFILFYFIGIVV